MTGKRQVQTPGAVTANLEDGLRSFAAAQAATTDIPPEDTDTALIAIQEQHAQEIAARDARIAELEVLAAAQAAESNKPVKAVQQATATATPANWTLTQHGWEHK